MMQHTILEEKTRTDGDSGIKQVRQGISGTGPIYTESYAGSSVASIHDHSNNIRTIGMGEFSCVLNGVEFRTRHNDYRLYMSHPNSSDYHKVEEIPFPDVPPEVKGQPTVDAQITEMQKWFKAWKEQNATERNYTKYFKPVLCYLEGAWTHSTSKVEEPFASDRHFIDASTWHGLYEKVSYMTYSGRKNTLENLSFLPTKIVGISNESLPIIVQWNYRILCQPLDRDVPLNRFRLAEDLKTKVSRNLLDGRDKNARSARFRLNPYDNDNAEKEGFVRYGLLDELMHKVPGKDNQQGQITDDAFGVTAYDLAHPNSYKKLDASKYHRYVLSVENDAMGQSIRKVGFADGQLFIALTTQSKILKRSTSKCFKKNKGVCVDLKTYDIRVSYAIPLEIIFMTPLLKWNPYNITLKGHPRSAEGETVTENGRNGKDTDDKAFNGANDIKHFLTPYEFFSGGEVEKNAADTSRSAVSVLDGNGKKRRVRASGTRIMIPEIPGIPGGPTRTRYPIMPVHAEGSAIWKELAALRKIVLKPKTYGAFITEKDSGVVANPASVNTTALTLITGMSRSNKVTPHQHEVALTSEDVTKLKNGESVIKVTTLNSGHTHTLVLLRNNKGRYWMNRCSGAVRCKDGHTRVLSEVKTP